jgi:hypothetical protein
VFAQTGDDRSRPALARAGRYAGQQLHGTAPAERRYGPSVLGYPRLAVPDRRATLERLTSNRREHHVPALNCAGAVVLGPPPARGDPLCVIVTARKTSSLFGQIGAGPLART